MNLTRNSRLSPHDIINDMQVQDRKTFAGTAKSTVYHPFTVKEDVHLLKPARLDVIPGQPDVMCADDTQPGRSSHSLFCTIHGALNAMYKNLRHLMPFPTIVPADSVLSLPTLILVFRAVIMFGRNRAFPGDSPVGRFPQPGWGRPACSCRPPLHPGRARAPQPAPRGSRRGGT